MFHKYFTHLLKTWLPVYNFPQDATVAKDPLTPVALIILKDIYQKNFDKNVLFTQNVPPILIARLHRPMG